MKICILAAGRGTRMGYFAELAHKALLPLGNQAILSKIIAQFAPADEFVIALGYQGKQIRDFLTIAHPKLKITFVEVQNYDQPGSGPGQSLYECREFLREPFIFTACDTLITSPLPDEEINWAGVLPVDNPEYWCTVKLGKNDLVSQFQYKVQTTCKRAFSGIAQIIDWEMFWLGFEQNTQLKGGELQVDNGLNALVEKGIKSFDLGWQDTGNLESYKKLLCEYQKNYTFYGKTTDITYRYGDQIIKFFNTESISMDRFQRALDYKNIFCDVLQQQGGFFSYKFVAGELLSSKLCYSTCFAALQWAQSNLWRNIEPPDKFSEVLDQFYIQKTFRRLDKFIATFESAPETEVVINQISCQPVAFLLEAIKPELINGGLASSFHGDFHSDNILITQQGFQLIDWRENFGNSFNVGDRYYDLGKFLHTLELSVESMDNHEFQIFRLSNREIKLEHSCDFSQIDGLEAFWDFVSLHGYSEKRIRFVNALIYINMSPLYEGDLARYLYYFGRYQLQKTYRQN